MTFNLDFSDPLASEARAWYLSTSMELNIRCREIAEFEPNLTTDFLAPLPTLDNNIWLTYPELAEFIRTKFPTTTTELSESTSGLQKRKYRSPIAIMIRGILIGFFSTAWRVHLPKTITPCAKRPTPVLGFTYSDLDPLSQGFFNYSRFWGELPSWEYSSQMVTWVGFGVRRGLNEHLSVFQSRTINLFEPATLTYIKSLPARLRTWNRMKEKLHSSELFQVLRNEFRSSILGAPALESVRLSKAFEILLDRSRPNSVLLPYENQLWQRVLSQQAHIRGVKVTGAIHTTSRFWDVRFFNPGEFHQFFPSVFVTNGPASEKQLRSLGISDSSLLTGTALRFSHLRRAARLASRRVDSRKEYLVVTGLNKNATIKMVEKLSSFSPPLRSLTFRPHPLALDWFKSRYPDYRISDLTFEDSLASFDAFICDDMSSLAFEFAVLGKKVMVYKAEESLNFSPMTLVRDFGAYFSDEHSFMVADDLQPPQINLEEYLALGGGRATWASIIRMLGGVSGDLP